MEPTEDLHYLLTEAGAVPDPRRGDLLTGSVIATDSYGMIIDLGLKRDGVVPSSDLELLPPEESTPRLRTAEPSPSASAVRQIS